MSASSRHGTTLGGASSRRALVLVASLASMLAAPLAARADEPRFPPLELHLGGRDRVQLGLAAQLRASASGDADHAQGEITLPRIRPQLRASLLDERLALALTLNTSPTALELIDAWVELTLAPERLRVRVGQWKVPFTRYRSGAFTELAFVDWARTVTVPFGAEHAIGVAASGTIPGAELRWDLGLFAGPPTRAGHGTGLAATYGERVENASALGALHPIDRVHPEIVGRVSRALGVPRAGVELSFSAAADLDPEPRRDLALRLAPELRAHAGIAAMQVVLYGGLAPLAGQSLAPALFGALAEVTIRPVPELELAFRFARTARTGALLEDARAYAAQSVDAAPSGERDARSMQHQRTGRIHAEQEVAIGASWMLVGRALELQADAAWLSEERDADVHHGWRLRLQLQIVL